MSLNKLPKLDIFATLLDLGVANTIDILVYKILTLRRKYRKQITVDAVALRKRIEKLCKKYGLCNVTVIRALKRLAKAGLIIFVYDVRGFGKYVIEVIPLHEYMDLGNAGETDVSDVVVVSNLDSETDTDNKSNETGIDQQQLIHADKKCRSVGIKFNKEDLWKVAKHSKEDISLAINAFKSSEIAESTHIRNPAGWLIRCLEKKYYRSYRPEKLFKSAEQKLFELQDWFIENIGSIPQRFEQLDIFRQKNTRLRRDSLP